LVKNRALRRASKIRMIKRAERIIKSWGWDCFNYSKEEQNIKIREMALKLADNMKICSCVMCSLGKQLKGKDRFKIRDRKVMEDIKNQLSEI